MSSFFKIGLFGALLAGSLGAQNAASDAVKRGEMYYRSSNCESAIKELRTATSEPKANLLLGRCYFESKQYAQAIEALTNYRKSDADHLGAVALLAQAYEHEGHADTAVMLLDEFLKMHPDQLAMHNAQGDLLTRQGRIPEAMEHFHAVTALAPDDPGARIGLGDLQLREQHWQEAIDEFQHAKLQAPGNFRVLKGLGTAYVRLGNCAPAMEPLRQALSLDPSDFPLGKMLGACDAAAQKWPELLAALRTGTPEEAADEEATEMVARAFQATMDPVGAEAYYRRVLAAAPGNVTAHTDLGDLLYDAKKRPEARIEYLEVVKLKPDSARIHERLGDMADTPAQIMEARQHYQAAADSKDGQDSARMKLARICYQQEDMACTNKALDGITTASLTRDVKLLRAQVEYKAENWKKAGALTDDLLMTDRQNLTVLRIAAEVAAHQNRMEDSSLLFEEAMGLDSTNQELRYRLVGIYLNNSSLNKFDRAVEILQDYLSRIKQDAEGYLLLGDAYRRRSDIPNAMQNFRNGFQRITAPIPERLSWAYNSYGYMLYQQGSYEEAYTSLTQATQLDSRDVSSLLNFALTCSRLGRTEELNDARAKLEKLNYTGLAELDAQIAADRAARENPGKDAKRDPGRR